MPPRSRGNLRSCSPVALVCQGEVGQRGRCASGPRREGLKCLGAPPRGGAPTPKGRGGYCQLAADRMRARLWSNHILVPYVAPSILALWQPSWRPRHGSQRATLERSAACASFASYAGCSGVRWIREAVLARPRATAHRAGQHAHPHVVAAHAIGLAHANVRERLGSAWIFCVRPVKLGGHCSVLLALPLSQGDAGIPSHQMKRGATKVTPPSRLSGVPSTP